MRTCCVHICVHIYIYIKIYIYICIYRYTYHITSYSFYIIFDPILSYPVICIYVYVYINIYIYVIHTHTQSFAPFFQKHCPVSFQSLLHSIAMMCLSRQIYALTSHKLSYNSLSRHHNTDFPRHVFPDNSTHRLLGTCMSSMSFQTS